MKIRIILNNEFLLSRFIKISFDIFFISDKNALGSGVAIRNDARYYVSIVNIEHVEKIK